MATNLPGPYEVQIRYTVGGIQHTQRLNCQVDVEPAPGTIPGNVSLLRRDAGTIFLSTAVSQYVAVMKPRFAATVTIDDYLFFKYDPGTNIKSFITGAQIADVGTNGGVTNVNHQETYTFYTQNGGILKAVLLESVEVSNIRIPYADLTGSAKDYADYIYDPATWIYARDNSYPIFPLNQVGGQNESVFKARNR